MLKENIQEVKTVGDITSVSILLGTLVDLLPSVAALLTIIWTAIRIYETDTVQNWLKRKKKE